MAETLRTPTLIIGAGPAGLAVAACLTQLRQPFLMLERREQVGASWQRHYTRLHLHTDKRHSALPGLPYPASAPRYPARQQVVDYLEAYAQHFGLHPRFGQAVRWVRWQGGRWLAQTQDTLYESVQVVLAAGNTQVPNIPTWPGQASFPGPRLHSSEYRDGERFRGQRVLVVGFGNSGGEIALDLWEHGAAPTLAVRGPVVVIPRDLLGVPIVAVALALRRLPARLADALTAPILWLSFGDLRRLGLSPAAQGPFTSIQQRARIPLIDIGTLRLVRQGKIAVRPGLAEFAGRQVVFADGRREAFDALVLATGYGPGLEQLLEPGALNARGEPARPGLYLCGYQVVATGMLREIGREAQKIARDIARQGPKSS
jgi:indole-3-pyruvate monooxygenase